MRENIGNNEYIYEESYGLRKNNVYEEPVYSIVEISGNTPPQVYKALEISPCKNENTTFVNPNGVKFNNGENESLLGNLGTITE